METPVAKGWDGTDAAGGCGRDLLRLTRGESTLATERLKHEPTTRMTTTTTRRQRPLRGQAIEAQGRKTKLLLPTRNYRGLPSRRAPARTPEAGGREPKWRQQRNLGSYHFLRREGKCESVRPKS
jgi:hypothetical protein